MSNLSFTFSFDSRDYLFLSFTPDFVKISQQLIDELSRQIITVLNPELACYSMDVSRYHTIQMVFNIIEIQILMRASFPFTLVPWACLAIVFLGNQIRHIKLVSKTARVFDILGERGILLGLFQKLNQISVVFPQLLILNLKAGVRGTHRLVNV